VVGELLGVVEVVDQTPLGVEPSVNQTAALRVTEQVARRALIGQRGPGDGVHRAGPSDTVQRRRTHAVMSVDRWLAETVLVRKVLCSMAFGIPSLSVLANGEVSVYELMNLLGQHESMTTFQRYISAAGTDTPRRCREKQAVQTA